MTSGPGFPLPTQERWRRVRRHLNGHRHDLALLAAELYPSSWQIADRPLLARDEWIPATPIALEHFQLTWRRREETTSVDAGPRGVRVADAPFGLAPAADF